MARATQPEDWRETPLTLTRPAPIDGPRGSTSAPSGGTSTRSSPGSIGSRPGAATCSLKFDAGQDVSLELLEGALLVREAAARADQIGTGSDAATWLLEPADALARLDAGRRRVAFALGTADDLAAMMHAYADRSRATDVADAIASGSIASGRAFGAWYEMFPRSAGPDPTRSAHVPRSAQPAAAHRRSGLRRRLPAADSPDRPSFRKGRNNASRPSPGDPGSPWAIGSTEGGHTAVEPGLGTLDDFDAFREEAERLGLEVALDLAWQCSPDHPWVREHPDWFRHRPDGTIKYAENPPKKYQDIYPLDFECDDWPALWQALLDVTLFWVDRGVRIFRVDNPHTKTFGFWEWMIDEVHAPRPATSSSSRKRSRGRR